MTTTPDGAVAPPEGAITDTARTKRITTGPVRVNLIPAELAEARVLRTTIVGMAGVAVVAAAIVGFLYHSQASKVSDAKAQLATAQAQNAKLKATQATLGNVDALYAKVDAAEGMIKAAEAPQVLFSRYLEDLRLQLPDHVWLTTLSATEDAASAATSTSAAGTSAAGTSAGGATAGAPASIGTLAFGGSAYTHNDVADLLDKLAALHGLNNPYLSNSTQTLIGTGATAVPTVTWSATAALTTDALKSSYDGTATP